MTNEFDAFRAVNFDWTRQLKSVWRDPHYHVPGLHGQAVDDVVDYFFWVFVKSCGRVLPQNEGEMPVDSGFMCLGRCSEFARESEMIPSDNGLRCRGADAGYFNEATAFA